MCVHSGSFEYTSNLAEATILRRTFHPRRPLSADQLFVYHQFISRQRLKRPV